MATGGDNGNGKVTMAVIGAKLDALMGEVRELKGDFKHKCEQVDENSASITGINRDIDHLKTGVRGWNIINSVGAFVAFILAALGIGSK
jgi:hypothetical protein